MKRYVIERDMPKIGEASNSDLREGSRKSNDVLAELGKDIQWVHSYVTGDKIFCIYLAAGEEVIRRHAELSGFPANKITEVKRIIDPTTPGGP